MNSKTRESTREPLELAIEESDPTRIVKWTDIVDTELMDIYFKQRVGPGFRMVPVVGISRADFISLLNATDGTDLYTRMCAEEPDAAIEAAFTYSAQTSKIVNITFHIESPNPGTRFLDFLKRHGTSDFHKTLVKHLLGVSRACHDLHVRWKSVEIEFHCIPHKRIPEQEAN